MSAAEEFFAKLSEIADDMGLDDTEHEHFVNTSMKRKGFKAIMQWTDPEPEAGETPDWFGANKEKRTRSVGNKRKSTGTYGGTYDD